MINNIEELLLLPRFFEVAGTLLLLPKVPAGERQLSSSHVVVQVL